MVEINLISLGTLIVVIGFALLFVGILLQSKGKASVEGGGIVFIGPFPIIGGVTSERAFYILIAIAVVFFLLMIFSELFQVKK